MIATLFAPLAGPGGLGLRDDTALLTPTAGRDQIVTVDALVAGVHFFADDAPASIARKALRVNLSDLAAKGAEPTGFVLALALPDGWTGDWLRDFADGLGRDAATFGCPLLGGDTVRTPGPLTISITALGTVPTGRMVPRTGARPGDRLYVSGTVGDAALGLKLRLVYSPEPGLSAGLRAFLLDRYLHPQPRLGLRATLLAYANGAMDVSDGLVGDLTKMLKASGVSGRLRLADVPLSEAATVMVKQNPELLVTAVTGGDDYEVLAAVPAARGADFEAEARAAGILVTAIGDVLEGEGPPAFLDASGRDQRFERGSFSHF